MKEAETPPFWCFVKWTLEYSSVSILNIVRQMEDMERQHIYFRGHTDAVAYLKKIKAI